MVSIATYYIDGSTDEWTDELNGDIHILYTYVYKYIYKFAYNIVTCVKIIQYPFHNLKFNITFSTAHEVRTKSSLSDLYIYQEISFLKFDDFFFFLVHLLEMKIIQINV